VIEPPKGSVLKQQVFPFACVVGMIYSGFEIHEEHSCQPSVEHYLSVT